MQFMLAALAGHLLANQARGPECVHGGAFLSLSGVNMHMQSDTVS
jgi:hypothetical protein